jgi:thioester reductase-like protein
MATVEPGLIVGTVQEGIANTDNFIWRYVAGAVSIGAYPIPGRDDWLEIYSVDRVAHAAIDVLLRDSIDPGFKVKMIDGIAMDDFWNTVIVHLGLLGHDLHPVSSHEWKRMIQLDIDARTESHPLWPVAHLLDSNGNLGKSVRPHNIGKAVDQELITTIGKNIHFLVSSGFLKAREVVK